MPELNIVKPHLTTYQADIINSPERFKLVIASTKIGKTFLGTWWLYSKMHQEERKNFLWLAPSYRQAEIAFDRIKIKCINSKLYKVNASDLSIEFKQNNSKITFRTSDNHELLYGFEYHAVIIDEAGRMSESAWVAVRSTITYTSAPIIFFSNLPKLKSHWFYKLAEKAKKTLDWKYWKITAYDAVEAGILKLEEIEEAKTTLTKRVFAELYLAEFGDNESALFCSEDIDKAKEDVNDNPDYLKICVSVDPAVTNNKNSDNTGIIVAGLDANNIVYILHDASGKYTPEGWANKAVELYNYYNANFIVAEKNQGGDMVRSIISNVSRNIKIYTVHAKFGKRLRAEPVKLKYEQGKVKHIKTFDELEEEMCNYDGSGNVSPDRLDAMVYAVTMLTVKQTKAFAIA